MSTFITQENLYIMPSNHIYEAFFGGAKLRELNVKKSLRTEFIAAVIVFHYDVVGIQV